MQHTSKAHKALALFSLFVGVSMFGFVIAMTEGWTPFPAANASETPMVAVIPVDEPVNIDIEVAAINPIKMDEIVIIGTVASKPSKPSPGAARRMPGRDEESRPVPSESDESNELSGLSGYIPMSGLSALSQSALDYQPGFNGRNRERLEERTAERRDHFVHNGESNRDTKPEQVFEFDAN